MPEQDRPRRRHRRAVGPPGAVRTEDAALPGGDPVQEQPSPGDDERLRADLPPHHDRGV